MVPPGETMGQYGEVLTFAQLPRLVGWPEASRPPEARAASDTFCLSAEQVEWLSAVREPARIRAHEIVSGYREKLYAGEFEAVPMDVDALGTAAKVAFVREKFGADSPEYAEAREGFLLDCARKVAEACTKNGRRYFGESFQQYDRETDMLFANGLSVDEMLVGGLSPLGETEELERRMHDWVNHVTTKEMVKRLESEGAGIIHVSLCPDWAIKSYANNPKGAHGGYAPETEKLMVGFDVFDHASGKVVHQQVGLSGKYITLEVVNEVYKALGINDEGGFLDKTAIYGTQGLVATEHIGDVFGVVRVLDEFASAQSGKNIFMGEVVGADHPKDYAAVIAESTRQREEEGALTEELAAFVEGLHAKGTDPALGTVLVERYLKDRLLDMAQENPHLAEMAFDRETAEGFRTAMCLRASGRTEEANRLINEVRINAPDASSCGAGSCGLEKVKEDEMTAAKEVLDYKEGEVLIKDGVRSCPDCKKTTVVYALNLTGGFKKACLNPECGAKDFGHAAGSRAPRRLQGLTFFSGSQNKAFRLEAGTATQ
jgi:hypothetical protein